MIAKSALLCFQLVAYREARGESMEAQIATMKILQNRSKKTNSHPCKEVAKKNQFAWVKKFGVVTPKPIGELDKLAWLQSQKLASVMNKVTIKGITPNHVYFNSLNLGKRYKTKTKQRRIGGLIFY